MFTFILLLIYFVSPQPRFTLIAEGSCKTLVLLVFNLEPERGDEDAKRSSYRIPNHVEIYKKNHRK